jgi:hypothetical protein
MPLSNQTCLVGPRVFRPEQGKAADLQNRSPHIAYAILATRCVVQSDGIPSATNLAALMAPEDQKSMHLQRLEDSNVRRLWRLINAFGKARQGALGEKILNRYERSLNVYENKGTQDRMPE